MATRRPKAVAAAPAPVTVPAPATSRNFTNTGRPYRMSPAMQIAAERAQYQPRLASMSSNVKE